jgi:rhodanese-related sulfurtransferase
MATDFATRVAEAKAAVEPITVDEAARLHREGAVVFVDPRPSAAIDSSTGHIPGARLVSLDDIAGGAFSDDLRHVQVITACQAGPMGAVAAHEFARHGMARVRYVEGGTQAWLDAGHPTVR